MRTDARLLVAELEDPSAIFRVQGMILTRGRDTVPALAAFLLGRPSPLPQARVAAAECLGVLGGDEAIAALIEALTHHDLGALSPAVRFAEQTVRDAAARALGKLRDPRAATALLAALGEQRLVGAGAALAMLGDARAVPGLIRLLEESAHGEASELLAAFGDDAVPALCASLDEPSSPDDLETPGSRQRRALAAELVGRIAGRAARAILRAHLGDASIRVRTACALVLARAGVSDDRAMLVLAQALDDPDCTVQHEAISQLDASGGVAVPALSAVLTDPTRSWRARSSAAMLIGRIGGDAAVAVLVRSVGDEHPQVRRSVLGALARFRGNPEAARALNAARSDAAPAVRSTARRLLRELRR